MLISILLRPPPGAPAPSDVRSRTSGTINLRVCPECAGPLIRASGCMHCAHCGWGRCG